MRGTHNEGDVSLDLIRTFFAVVEQGSLNRAAERLRLSQSTLTRQIQALEAEIGGRLLERTSSGVVPTATGLALLEGMRPVLAKFDVALQNVRRQARGQSAILRVGYLLSATSEYINPALAALRRTHREIRVTLLDLSPGEQIAALKKGEIDVGLIGQAGAFLSRDFYTRKLADLPVVVALAETHPLTARSSLRLTDLKREVFVSAREEDVPGHNCWVARLCRRAGFRARFGEEANSLTHGFALTVTEGLVTLVAEYLKNTPIPGVAFRPLKDVGAKWEMYVAWQRGNVSESLKVFLDALPVEKR